MSKSIRNEISMIALLVAMTGCTAGSAVGPKEADHASSDDAAIRRTLATTEERINNSDAGFVDVFANDAVIVAPRGPDIVGFDAIRTMYGNLLKQSTMTVHFSTQEVTVAGDMAVERGTYTLKITDRATGRTLQDGRNKHIHVFRRQPDGTWKTWRMMVNSAETPPNSK